MEINPNLDLVSKAKAIAEYFHLGQYRQGGCEPYFNHLERVASHFAGGPIKAAAWLHDILEDTVVTEETLQKHSIPEEVIQTVKILTRDVLKESYYDFIFRIVNSGNVAAMFIKISDIEDNISDLKEGHHKDKYRFARYIICQKLTEMGELKKC